MSDGMDFYDLLGVGPEATPDDIRRAFRQQVRNYHPDLNDDPRAPAQFTALKKAYDTLADPKERDAYDRLGHEEYVRERISGLPSVDRWQSPDGSTPGGETPADQSGGDVSGSQGEATQSNGHSRRQGTTGTTNGTATADSSGDGLAGSAGNSDSPDGSDWESTEAADDLEFDFEFDFDFDGATADEPDVGGTGAGSGSTVAAEQGSTVDGFVIGSDATESGSLADAVEFDEESFRDSSAKKSPTASGAGTARGPKTAPDPGEPGSSKLTATDEYTEEGPSRAGAGPSLPDRLRRAVRWTLGWPLVALADGLYLATLGVYYVVYAEELGSLAAAVGSAGPIAAVTGSTYGIEGLSGIVAGTAAGSTPLYALVALMGVTVLPSVYLLLVTWTRSNRRAWQPSYLYVLGAIAPAAGMIVAGLAPQSGLALDLLAYVVVPLVTMVAMVFFGQLLPRGRRLVRQYLYRLTN